MDGLANTSSNAASPSEALGLGGYAEPQRPSRLRRVLKWSLVSIAAIALIGSAGFYFYWQTVRTTPQYSLALIVDAAKKNDQATINRLVDIDEVVEDFMPQITAKAVELFGRGVAPDVIQRVAKVAEPVMPALKSRARDELPAAIRNKTSELGYVPFEAMVLGAERYLDIAIDGDRASIKGRDGETDIELGMKREGDRWKIVSLRDDRLATTIAQRVGQEIIAIAADSDGNTSRSRLGVQNINELLNEAEKIFK